MFLFIRGGRVAAPSLVLQFDKFDVSDVEDGYLLVSSSELDCLVTVGEDFYAVEVKLPVLVVKPPSHYPVVCLCVLDYFLETFDTEAVLCFCVGGRDAVGYFFQGVKLHREPVRVVLCNSENCGRFVVHCVSFLSGVTRGLTLQR